MALPAKEKYMRKLLGEVEDEEEVSHPGLGRSAARGIDSLN